jgi:hypothetical protein
MRARWREWLQQLLRALLGRGTPRVDRLDPALRRDLGLPDRPPDRERRPGDPPWPR